MTAGAESARDPRAGAPGSPAGNASDWLTGTRESYDTVAEAYTDLLEDYLRDDAHDRAQLALFADLVLEAGGGPVADVGCGPGHITAHLHGLGLDVVGIDLSPKMIARARRDHPGLRFQVASMTDMDLPDAGLAGVLAWYSLIHAPDEDVVAILERFSRALRPGGVLVVAFHVGDQVSLKTQGYGGLPMNVRVHRRQVEKVTGWLLEAGFTIEASTVRDPRAPVPQGRLLARRP